MKDRLWTLAFAFAGQFAVAVASFWAIRVVRSLAGPVYSTWLNSSSTGFSRWRVAAMK